MKIKKIKGKHFLFDLHGCNHHDLNDRAGLESILLEAAAVSRMEVLNSHFHAFNPQGVTGLVLLATSHISVHTWPEYGYAAFDVFSCSDEAQTRLAVDHIISKVKHKRKKIHGVDRGFAELKTIEIPVYKTNTKKKIRVHKKLAEIQSEFQKIQVFDLEDFGKTLLIDGITQASESDTHLYDRAITKPLKSTDKEILILGGGDGFVAAHILKKNPQAHVTIVELDQEVVYCAEKYFNQKQVFEDPRVTLVVGDAMHFLKISTEFGRKFDGIIIDLTDEPVGSGRALAKLKAFFSELLTHAVPLLTEKGWVSTQAGVPKVKRPRTAVHPLLREVFEEHLANVTDTTVTIPSFLDDNVFLFGRKPRHKKS